MSEEALQIAEERREAKSRGEREDIPNRIQSPNEQFKEVEENKRMGKTIKISSRKLEISNDHFM